MEHEMLKYIRLVKVDEASHEVWGVATSEVPDKDREIADYEESKKAFRIWSDEFLAKTTAAGQEPSMGNIRLMHQLEIAGKAIKIEYRDATREIWLGTRPVDDKVWNLIQKGYVTGYSIGGSYAWKRSEGAYKRFAPIIAEVSYVDNGCNPDATFAYIKADGAVEMRKFVAAEPVFSDEQLRKINDLITSASGGNQGGSMTQEEVAKLVKAELEKTHKSLHDHLDNLHKAMMENCDKAVGMCEKTAAMHKDAMEMCSGHIMKLKKALGGEAENDHDADDEAKKAREAAELAKAEKERLEKAEKEKLERAAADAKAKEDQEKLDKAVAEARTQAEKDALLKAAADLKAKEEKEAQEKLDKATAEVAAAERKALTETIAAMVKSQTEIAAKIEELTKARGSELEETRTRGLTLVGRDGSPITKAAEISGDPMRHTGI